MRERNRRLGQLRRPAVLGRGRSGRGWALRPGRFRRGRGRCRRGGWHGGRGRCGRGAAVATALAVSGSVRCRGRRARGRCRRGPGGCCRRSRGRARRLVGARLPGRRRSRECFLEPADNRRLDCGGRRSHELAHFLELGHHGLALYAELLRELVYPDLRHCAPSTRSGSAGPVNRSGQRVLRPASASAVHRRMLIGRSSQSQPAFPGRVATAVCVTSPSLSART
jgi:hypothetical protein